MDKKAIISIIEPQFSSEASGIRWYRTLTPADVVLSKPFFGLEIIQSGESNLEPPIPKAKELRDVSFYQYLLDGRYSLRVDNEKVKQMNAGDFIAFNAGNSTILEEVFLPVYGKLEGFRIWVDQKNKAKQTRSIDINPNHSKKFFNHRSIQVQELFGSFQIDLKQDEFLPSDVNILNVSLQKNTSFEWKPPQDHNVMIFVFQGRGIFGPYAGEDESLVSRYRLLLFGEGDEIYVRTEDTPLRFIIITGSNK